MNKKKNKFSIIIPVHNKLPHIDRAIQSVLNQSYQNFELILIDDASTDGSSEKLKEYKDSRIRRFRRDIPGPGGYAARNLGIKESKYGWIAFLDADDEWNENYLQNLHRVIEKNNPEIVCAKWAASAQGNQMVPKELESIKRAFVEFSLIDFFKNHSMIWTSAVAIKRQLLLNVGGFPEGRCKRGGDLDTWVRCLAESSKNVYINDILAVYYRDTVNQVTNDKVNPAITLCSFESIKQIRKNTKDKMLIAATDVFCAKFTYNFMIKQLRASHKINKSWLHTIGSRRIRAFVLTKVYVYNVLMRLNIK